MTPELAAKSLDKELRPYPWYISVGVGETDDAEPALFLYEVGKTPRAAGGVAGLVRFQGDCRGDRRDAPSGPEGGIGAATSAWSPRREAGVDWHPTPEFRSARPFGTMSFRVT